VTGSCDAVAAAYDRIEADGRDGIWIELVDREHALSAAAEVDARGDLPLAGTTLAVKGNIDVAGHRTTAACPTFGEVADRSAAAVVALERAGAVVVGITNLDQFATGLVGTRSPYGICPNAHWPGLISGGSSAGSAVAVAAGLVDLALGTDTAGSGRVPAAANGIVGFKPTRGWISTRGVLPACRSLDCVAVFAATPDAANRAVRLAAGFDAEDPWSRRRPDAPAAAAPRIGYAAEHAPPIDVSDAVEIDLAPFLDAGDLLYGGAFVAERYAAVGSFVDSEPEGLDPVVARIIRAAGELPAWALAEAHTELRRLQRLTDPTWQRIDVLAVPSVSRIPTIDEVLADPIGVNTELGRYTNFVNLLDLCALTLPVGPGGPPASVTLIAPAWREDDLLAVARRFTLPQ
jgi:allophanate hydrolase